MAIASKKLEWWRLMFKINTIPKYASSVFEGEGLATRRDVDWWIDLFIIDMIIRPLVKKEKFDEWRLHRRWAQDESGHICSLLVKCSPGMAKKLVRAIEQSKYFKILKKSKTFFRDFDCLIQPPNADEFPDEITACWPIFMQGVSTFFLAYIEELHKKLKDQKVEKPTTASTLVGYRSYYKEMNGYLGSHWHWYGCHAFFHHINAIFGYEHLQVQFREYTGMVGNV